MEKVQTNIKQQSFLLANTQQAHDVYVCHIRHFNVDASHDVADVNVTLYTDNPLYTDTRYSDKICYNDNLTVTKTSLKR